MYCNPLNLPNIIAQLSLKYALNNPLAYSWIKSSDNKACFKIKYAMSSVIYWILYWRWKTLAMGIQEHGHFVDKEATKRCPETGSNFRTQQSSGLCFWFWRLGVIVHYCCPLLCKFILKNCIASLSKGENSGFKSMVSLEFIVVSLYYNAEHRMLNLWF